MSKDETKMSLEKALELLDVACDLQFKEEDGLRLSLATTRLAMRQIIEYLNLSTKVNEE